MAIPPAMLIPPPATTPALRKPNHAWVPGDGAAGVAHHRPADGWCVVAASAPAGAGLGRVVLLCHAMARIHLDSIGAVFRTPHLPASHVAVLADLRELIVAGLHNPKLDAVGPQQDLTYLRGRIALAQRQPDAALADFIQALDLQVRPGMALQAAATLGAAGYPAQGLRLLDHYRQVEKNGMPPGFGMPMLHAWVLARQNYWPHELAHLRHQLSLDVAANAHTAPDNPDLRTDR